MPRNKRNTRKKHRGGEIGTYEQSPPNKADEMVNNLGSSTKSMGSNALETTKSATSSIGSSFGNMADSIMGKSSDSMGKAKGWFSGLFSSSSSEPAPAPAPAMAPVGGRSRRRRGGIGSHWASKSHPLYLNPSANAKGDNIYNLAKGGSVKPYATLESTPSNTKSSYVLDGGKRRRRTRKRRSSRRRR